MFKYFLNLNNENTYGAYYELHKKNCPLVKQALSSGNDELLDLGFFDNSSSAMVAGQEALLERALDPGRINGCLACSKECHKR